MAPPPSKPPQQFPLTLTPTLKSCLANLPAPLVHALANADAVAQNVVVELSFAGKEKAGAQGRDGQGKGGMRSVFVGWTGMQAMSSGRVEGSGRGAEEVGCVEVDVGFARDVGLEGVGKVGVQLHLDPPLAHTVHIEPVTAADWEIIELHANFLEMNFLSQIRALPNPSSGTAASSNHSLTLHLTPTSTAHVSVTSLTPAASASQPFVKISPDAEVIVAPKTQQSEAKARDSRSVASASRRSASGRSTGGAARRSGTVEDEKARPPLFLRGVARSVGGEWFDDEPESKDTALKVWVDREHLLSKTLRGVSWVAVTVIKPAGLQDPGDPQQAAPVSQEPMPAGKVVARLCAWEDAPDAQHVALSSLLAATLGTEGIVGGIVRVEPAPPALPRTASAMKEPSQGAGKEAIVKRVRVTPFAGGASGKKDGFRFGGESKAEKEESASRIRGLFGAEVLEGPVTDGMLLPKRDDWPGGILDFEPAPPGDPMKAKTHWLLGGDRRLEISVQAETAPPKLPQPPGEPLPETKPVMVGVDALTYQTRTSLLHTSSVLLTGGLGSGKTSLAHVLAHELREAYLYHTIYFPCRTLVTDETRVKSIKETLQRVFASAAWGARLGGRALVVLDDLDRLCPVEQELQMDANGRSKQVSELLCSIARQYCGRNSGVVLLATAQSKEAVHNVVVGGHVVRDILALKAPTKDGRRRVLEMLVKQASEAAEATRSETVDMNGHSANEWMEGSEPSRPASRDSGTDSTTSDPIAHLDLLDIAGQTDGYMPGDLALLVSRARSESLIRALTTDASPTSPPSLTPPDFTAGLAGFTPASLRGVTLHSSTTTFASIGGLHDTRRTLLETFQYPTTYAPLFASCPLRLRSGLLLYGYPGSGKTLLASAVAGECGLNFISVKGPEILNKYIGASEKSVRDLFERAEAAKPCVLFFDEFDSIAPKRGHDSTGVTDRVVNMLLTMMDGAEGLSGVYVLAATSRPDLIDPALLRPGRLDKSLLCDMPGEVDRWDILKAVSGKLKFEPAVVKGEGRASLREVARRTHGYSGADLQAVVYNAHLEAIHDVLGPADGQQKASSKTRANSGSNTRASESGRHGDFTYFRLGDDPSGAPNGTSTSTPAAPHPATERAAIAAQLSALHSTRKRAKEARHALQAPASTSPHPLSSAHLPNGTPSASQPEQADPATPTITYAHLERSLAQTRASISAPEQARLRRIYREFVVGRSGELSDGQGGSEVGGRTSLM